MSTTRIEQESPFSVGDAVGVATGNSFNRTWRQDEILRIHKNGNFVLKSNPRQQYRQRGGYAVATGDRSIRRAVYPLTKDVVDEIASYALQSRFREAYFKLGRVNVDKVTTDLVEAIERFLKGQTE